MIQSSKEADVIGGTAGGQVALEGRRGSSAVHAMKCQRLISAGMSSHPLISIVGVLLHTILSCRGDKVHCYCNSPRCVGYSYMCVSEHGCFTQVTTDPSQYSRGCVEDLAMVERCLKADEETFKRLNRSLIRTSETLDLGVPILSCCYDDMCNYANYGPHDKRGDSAEHDQLIHQDMTSLSSKAVWFRAAVIAVPIAGICILILLAMLASRLLNSDPNKPSLASSYRNNYSATTNNYTEKRTSHQPGPLNSQEHFRQHKRALYLNSTLPMRENRLHQGRTIRNSFPGDQFQGNLRFQETFDGECEGLLSSNHERGPHLGLTKCPNDAAVFLPHQHIVTSQYYPVRTEKLEIV